MSWERESWVKRLCVIGKGRERVGDIERSEWVGRKSWGRGSVSKERGGRD